MILYGFALSSGAYRVRIALALKGIAAEMRYVNLSKGEQKADAFAQLNPQKLVPVLVDQGRVLTQSLAIIEYLEEVHPLPALLPKAPGERARVRAIAQLMACDIAPLNNLKVRQYVTNHLQADERKWIQHWTHEGLAALETMLAESAETGRFCHGDAPTLADCCLMPQLFHAQRFGCELNMYPTLTRIVGNCAALPAFQAAHPEAQADKPA